MPKQLSLKAAMAWMHGSWETLRNGRQDSFTSFFTRLTRKGREVCQTHFLKYIFCHIQFNSHCLIVLVVIIICFLAQSQSTYFHHFSAFFRHPIFPLLPNHPDYFFHPMSIINPISHLRKIFPILISDNYSTFS